MSRVSVLIWWLFSWIFRIKISHTPNTFLVRHRFPCSVTSTPVLSTGDWILQVSSLCEVLGVSIALGLFFGWSWLTALLSAENQEARKRVISVILITYIDQTRTLPRYYLWFNSPWDSWLFWSSPSRFYHCAWCFFMSSNIRTSPSSKSLCSANSFQPLLSNEILLESVPTSLRLIPTVQVLPSETWRVASCWTLYRCSTQKPTGITKITKFIKERKKSLDENT